MLSAGAGKLGLFSTNREKHLARIAIFPEVDKAQHSSKEEHRDAIQGRSTVNEQHPLRPADTERDLGAPLPREIEIKTKMNRARTGHD